MRLTVTEAKAQLTNLVKLAETGEDVAKLHVSPPAASSRDSRYRQILLDNLCMNAAVINARQDSGDGGCQFGTGR